jgi:hypothetical protein
MRFFAHDKTLSACESLENHGMPNRDDVACRFIVRDGKLVGDKGRGRSVSRTTPVRPS